MSGVETIKVGNPNAKAREKDTRNEYIQYKLFEDGLPPKRAHFDDAGIDLVSCKDFTLAAHSDIKLDLNIAFAIPTGWCGVLCNKSGLNMKHNIQTKLGVLDASYRNHVIVHLHNDSDKDYKFERGDKVTQMVLLPVGLFKLQEVNELPDGESDRGLGGFGSSGRK